MATQTIVSVDFGACTLKVAEFSVSSNGLTLNNFLTLEHGADPTKEGDNWEGISSTLKQALAQLGTKQKRVGSAVAGQSVYYKFIKLPPIDQPDKIKQIIRYEAQQNVPFPIEQVVWDYQKLPQTGGEMEVMLVAVKSEVVEQFYSVTTQAGYQSILTDVSSMALYNAYRYNYPEHKGCVLIVDIGARTTNLIFVEKDRFFARTIPVGGNTFSTTIASEFQVSFADAENLKKTQGFVGLGGAYEEPSDPTVARLCKIIRQGMTRLHTEISRSIIFYKTQQGGSNPTKILLSGGSSVMGYTSQFFREKIPGAEVDYLNPVSNVSLSPRMAEADLSKIVHCLGEVVGLAVRQIGSCPVEINLEPQSVVVNRANRQRIPAYIGIAIAVVLMVVLGSLKSWKQYQLVNQELEKVRSFNQGLQQKETEIKVAREKEIKLISQYTDILNTTAQKVYWAELLNDLNLRMDHRIWIASFQPDKTGGPRPVAAPKPTPGPQGKKPKNAPPVVVEKTYYIIEGFCLNENKSTDGVTKFVKNLKDSPFFDIVDENAVILALPTPSEDDAFFPFKLKVALKPTAEMDKILAQVSAKPVEVKRP